MRAIHIPSEVEKEYKGDVVAKALHETHPNWTQDGFGLRGQQELSVHESARPVAMHFGIDTTTSKGSGTPIP